MTLPTWAYNTGTIETINHPLGDLFSFGCKNFPNKIAIADRKQRFSFRELEELALSLAHYLKLNHHISAGDRVMVLTQKTCLVPPLAVAIWKLGAVYMPVDGDQPDLRITTLVERAAPALVIGMGQPIRSSIKLVELSQMIANAQTINLESVVTYCHDSQEIAYIIHTSGSTGVPKGVQISVESLKQYFFAHNKILQYHPGSRVFSLSPYHFDVSIEDTFLPLSLGAFVYQFNSFFSSNILRRALIQQEITHLIAVSTLLTMISDKPDVITHDAFPFIEMVMTGAELCAPAIINLWKERLPNARVINVYGPTEVTIVSTYHVIEKAEVERSIAYPIGLPLDGVDTLLLDSEGREVIESDAPGELCLGGVQVMHGYLNQDEETSRRIFLRDGVRFYRSGDICFRDKFGRYNFVGRNDSEIKLNGRRIHLGEIQNQCISVQGVERSAVGVIERENTRLIGVVIVAETIDVLDAVRKHLAKILPNYMWPAVWGHTTSFVLSGSGKTDDKSLLLRLNELYCSGESSIIKL
jgi:D-alanine--poly(phosphoribitol) ligase subunit 1